MVLYNVFDPSNNLTSNTFNLENCYDHYVSMFRYMYIHVHVFIQKEQNLIKVREHDATYCAYCMHTVVLLCNLHGVRCMLHCSVQLYLFSVAGEIEKLTKTMLHHLCLAN